MKLIGKCRIERTVATLTGLIALAVVPAWADGTLGLGEVLIAVEKAPKLVAEIRAELAKNKLTPAEVTCIAARHGRHWTYLGGGRVAPYRCDIGQRSLVIEAVTVYFDSQGKLLGDLDKVDPKQAKTFQESDFRWAWTL